MSFSALRGSAIVVEGFPVRAGDASRVSQTSSVLSVAGTNGIAVVNMTRSTVRVVVNAREHFVGIALSSDDGKQS